MRMSHTIAFIDGQNLYLWISAAWWSIDYKKFRIYLRDKFDVQEAYYYLWFVSENEQDLYNQLQKAWFIVIFREHSSSLKWKKKWNVDVDIVFDIMKRMYEKKDFDDIVLVSWDGDYIKVVKHLIQHKILKKIIFPNKQYSSLYKAIKPLYGMNLSVSEVQHKIAYTKKEVS